MHIRAILILSVLVISACATAGTAREVSAFIERRDLCDHFRGEIPDPEQVEAMRETLGQIDRYCTGTDAALTSLKARYGNDSSVMEKLNRYEVTVERKDSRSRQ